VVVMSSGDRFGDRETSPKIRVHLRARSASVMACSRHAIGAGQVARFGSVSNRSLRVLQHARAAEGPMGSLMAMRLLLQSVIEPGGKHHRGAQDPECLTATFRPVDRTERLPAPIANILSRTSPS
jgi:hypothetical protein